MSRPYTVSLGSSGVVTAGGYTLATARVGYVTIVRDIVISNLAAQSTFSVYDVGPGGQITYWVRQTVAADACFHLSFRQTLLPGHSLGADSGSSSWCIAATGYELIDEP